jgi:hypothetical protein
LDLKAFEIFASSIQNSKTAPNASKKDQTNINEHNHERKMRPEEFHMSKECETCQKMIGLTDFSNHAQNCKSNVGKDPLENLNDITETNGIDFNNCSKPVENSGSNLNEKNHEEMLESPIINLAVNTDNSTDPFPEYENIHFEEDSKTHVNLKPAEKNHTSREDIMVPNIEEENEHLEANNDFQKYDSVNNEDFVAQKVS